MANPPAGQASAWTSRLTHSSTPIHDRGPWVGRGKCSAGACPPLGSGWGVAESAAPIRCAKLFVLFHTLVCRP